MNENLPPDCSAATATPAVITEVNHRLVPITIDGFTIHSQLDEGTLRAVSDDSGGKYYNATNEEELYRIYNDLQPKLTIKSEEMEITSIFAAVGMLALVIGGALSLMWFGRVP